MQLFLAGRRIFLLSDGGCWGVAPGRHDVCFLSGLGDAWVFAGIDLGGQFLRVCLFRYNAFIQLGYMFHGAS